MCKGTYVSYRKSKDGKFYMYGYYPTGASIQMYDIGKITKDGAEVIDTVKGFSKASRFFKQLQTMEAK